MLQVYANHPETFVLTHIDLYNWGAFGGRHCAEIDLQGTAIIGPTGSGKTTLVDALMTLLTAYPRYNLASTGGHESDRDLISYVRGMSGVGNNGLDNAHIARNGKTVTGIAARFANKTEQVRIGAIFWTEGTGSDLKKLWIFAQAEDHDLDRWLDLHHNGGARALKQARREVAGLEMFDSKKAYLARLHAMFAVGENAFMLLNRTAGLKQLNSIDEIFRELVLEDHSAFQRAGEVANEFDDLVTIHSELETAKNQINSLQPVANYWQKYQKIEDALKVHQAVYELIPRWYAIHGCQLWDLRLQELNQTIAAYNAQKTTIEQTITAYKEEADALYAIYLKAGGNTIESLKKQIKMQNNVVYERQRNAKHYQHIVKQLQLADELTLTTFTDNQTAAKARQNDLQQQLELETQTAWDLGSKARELEQQLTELKAEYEATAQRRSNIPDQFQHFRTLLAEQLNQSEEHLPFVAELVEVKAEESDWRGAIERAIGSHRLHIMVPPEAIETALNWVNQRNNRLHVRLLEVRAPKADIRFLDQGFTHKLNFKKHPYRESIKNLLAGIDRHCVASPEILRKTPHSMTQQGLMSGKKDFFEKQDQKRLTDDWMTGFDNRDRLELLTQQIQVAEQDYQARFQAKQQAEQQAKQTKQQCDLLAHLLELNFEQIDLPHAERELQQLTTQLTYLESPESEVGQAAEKLKAVNAQLVEQEQQRTQLDKKLGGIENEHKNATRQRDQLAKRLSTELTAEEQQLATQKLPLPDASQLENWHELEKAVMQEWQQLIAANNKQLEDCKRNLVREMGKAKTADTGALSEVGTEVEDVQAYLTRLQVLEQEALPEKLKRFQEYLTHSSDQGVVQLLMNIQNEVTHIEERITELNQTLAQVDFQPNRYLQLAPKPVEHESLRTLHQLQRELRAARLKEDQGESHFKALQKIIDFLRLHSEKTKTKGAQALLDPRYRLQFAVNVLARDSSELIETRTSSQGGSGGEKEIIASYVLTASLSYALCPAGSRSPLFGTIVLDEAFSKSSQVVAGRIILALAEFGLHPLFVTPNKELRLLRSHTRSAIVVHRKHLQATLTSLSWEALEQHAQQQHAARAGLTVVHNEVTL